MLVLDKEDKSLEQTTASYSSEGDTSSRKLLLRTMLVRL